VYTGSAGDKESEHFGRVRQRAVEESDKRLMFMEWSIDACSDLCPKDCEDHDPQDPESQGWDAYVKSCAMSNPGLGFRISMEGIESERKSMSREAFAMERLGVGDWPVEGEGFKIIPEEHWFNCFDEVSQASSPYVFSLDVSPDRRYSCISVAGANGEGKVHTEITAEATAYGGFKIDHRAGTKWVVPRLINLHKSHKGSLCVVDKGSQAGSF
jgi:hypothetical protein